LGRSPADGGVASSRADGVEPDVRSPAGRGSSPASPGNESLFRVSGGGATVSGDRFAAASSFSHAAIAKRSRSLGGNGGDARGGWTLRIARVSSTGLTAVS
jgi:hypothetical protein